MLANASTFIYCTTIISDNLEKAFRRNKWRVALISSFCSLSESLYVFHVNIYDTIKTVLKTPKWRYISHVNLSLLKSSKWKFNFPNFEELTRLKCFLCTCAWACVIKINNWPQLKILFVNRFSITELRIRLNN